MHYGGVYQYLASKVLFDEDFRMIEMLWAPSKRPWHHLKIRITDTYGKLTSNFHFTNTKHTTYIHWVNRLHYNTNSSVQSFLAHHVHLPICLTCEYHHTSQWQCKRIWHTNHENKVRSKTLSTLPPRLSKTSTHTRPRLVINRTMADKIQRELPVTPH